MKRKLVVLINDAEPAAQYLDFLKIDFDVEVVNNSSILKGDPIPSIDLMLFTGGEDVDPAIYGEKIGKHTAINQERDIVESKMFRRMNAKVPKLGICRGAQFVTVMSGGKLIQHVDNHGIGGTHPITFNHFLNPGKRIAMTSTHHQMMYPFNMNEKDYILCAHSTNHLSPRYWNGNDRNIDIHDDFLEPEIVFYPKTNSLAIQGHPESGVMTEDDKKLILNYISVVLKL